MPSWRLSERIPEDLSSGIFIGLAQESDGRKISSRLAAAATAQVAIPSYLCSFLGVNTKKSLTAGVVCSSLVGALPGCYLNGTLPDFNAANNSEDLPKIESGRSA